MKLSLLLVLLCVLLSAAFVSANGDAVQNTDPQLQGTLVADKALPVRSSLNSTDRSISRPHRCRKRCVHPGKNHRGRFVGYGRRVCKVRSRTLSGSCRTHREKCRAARRSRGFCSNVAARRRPHVYPRPSPGPAADVSHIFDDFERNGEEALSGSLKTLESLPTVSHKRYRVRYNCVVVKRSCYRLKCYSHCH